MCSFIRCHPCTPGELTLAFDFQFPWKARRPAWPPTQSGSLPLGGAVVSAPPLTRPSFVRHLPGLSQPRRFNLPPLRRPLGAPGLLGRMPSPPRGLLAHRGAGPHQVSDSELSLQWSPSSTPTTRERADRSQPPQPNPASQDGVRISQACTTALHTAPGLQGARSGCGCWCKPPQKIGKQVGKHMYEQNPVR